MVTGPRGRLGRGAFNNRQLPPAAARAAPVRAQAAAAPPRPAANARPSLLTTALIFTLVVFMIVPEGFDYDAHITTGIPLEGSALSRFIWLALLAFGAAVPLARSGEALKLIKQINVFLFLYIALAFASVIWSIDPALTIRRLVRVMTILLDGVALSLLGWSATRFQSLLRMVLTSVLVASVIFVMMAPGLAIEQSLSSELLGAWHGLATHKNGFGSVSACAVILWVHAWLSKETRWWWTVFGLAISVTCLVHSRSSTSIMAAAFASMLLVMLLRSPHWMKRFLPYIVGLFVCILLLYGLAVLHLLPGSGTVLAPITLITGKDQTFSNRVDIWNVLINHIAVRPVTGSGFNAYWAGAVPSSDSYTMWQALGYYPGEGHNGYLDVINDLGVPGAAFLLGYLVTYVRQGLKVFALARTQGALYLALMFQQLMGDLSESHWFNAMMVDFVILTLATVCMGRTLMDLKADRREAAGRGSAPQRNTPPRLGALMPRRGQGASTR